MSDSQSNRDTAPTIFVVDDNPQNLRLSTFLLQTEGFRVSTATSGEEALSILQVSRPDLVLLDIQLPGTDGLTVTRELRQFPHLAGLKIVALTSYAMEGDKEVAFKVGFDGYLTKPIDTRQFASQVRSFLAVPVDVAKAEPVSLEDEIAAIRIRFLAEVEKTITALLDSGNESLDDEDARRAYHQWEGTGATLGVPEFSRAARDLQELLGLPDAERQADAIRSMLRMLQQHIRYLERQPECLDALLSEGVPELLEGLRVALCGFGEQESLSLTEFFTTVNAFARAVVPVAGQQPGIQLRAYDVVLVNAGDWHASHLLEAGQFPDKPMIVVGLRPAVMTLVGASMPPAVDFLIQPAGRDELAMRVAMAVQRARLQQPPFGEISTAERPSVLVADDDHSVYELLRHSFRRAGIETTFAANGDEALRMAREQSPSAVVLDVTMPGQDGFQVLRSLRGDASMQSIPIVMLTASRQETDILSAFAMGADDYVVKPFSPLELTARVGRLLRTATSVADARKP